MLILKDSFTLYNRVRSKGNNRDIRLTNYRNDKNDNGNSKSINKGCNNSSGVNKGYDINNINEKVAKEVIKHFT